MLSIVIIVESEPFLSLVKSEDEAWLNLHVFL